jgi:hypothetical protein
MDQTLIGTCASCDKENLPVYDIFAYDQSKFCRQCIQRYGKETLVAAANAALAAKKLATMRTHCIRCNAELLTARDPMCNTCQGVYRDRFGKGVRFI